MRHLSPVLPDASIHQAKANEYTERICDPVTQVCAAVESGLYELNNGAEFISAD